MQTFQFLSYPIDFNPLSYSYMCCNSTFKFQPQSSSRGKIRVQGWKWIARMANILAINKTKTKAVSNSKQNFRFETRVFLLTLISGNVWPFLKRSENQWTLHASNPLRECSGPSCFSKNIWITHTHWESFENVHFTPNKQSWSDKGDKTFSVELNN